MDSFGGEECKCSCHPGADGCSVEFSLKGWTESGRVFAWTWTEQDDKCREAGAIHFPSPFSLFLPLSLLPSSLSLPPPSLSPYLSPSLPPLFPLPLPFLLLPSLCPFLSLPSSLFPPSPSLPPPSFSLPLPSLPFPPSLSPLHSSLPLPMYVSLPPSYGSVHHLPLWEQNSSKDTNTYWAHTVCLTQNLSLS